MLTDDSVVLLLFVIIYSTKLVLFYSRVDLYYWSKHKGTKLILNLASSKCQAN